jgi:GNAT superfamily N-acetyltransferase
VDLHRDIRLQALRDAPDAFGTIASEAEAQPLSYWEDLTRSVTEPGRHAMFLACEGDTVLGSAYGLLDPDQREAGRALLQAVMAWARGRRLTRLGLWAGAHSPAAVALYRRAGCRETGRRQPLPTIPALQILEMACEL